MNFIDIHCHILPGIDDGPSALQESLDMMEAAKRDGISHIFATPHIIDGLYPNKGKDIIPLVQRLREQMPGGPELFYGADVRITPFLAKKMESGEVPTLNGTGYILIEFPEFVVPPNTEPLLFDLRQRGFTPILTHPERHLRLMHDLKALKRQRDAGMMCQLTAMSITGDFGREIQRASFTMIEKALADFVASDAHNTGLRPPVLSKAYREVKKHFGEKTADALFLGNPGRILENVKPL